MASRLATIAPTTTATNGKRAAKPVTRSMTRVECQADNPDPRRHGQPCGNPLGDIPAGYRFVGLAARRPNAPDGRLRIKCSRSDCKTWNVFDVPHE